MTKSIRDTMFYGEAKGIDVTTMQGMWQRLLTPHTRGAVVGWLGPDRCDPKCKRVFRLSRCKVGASREQLVHIKQTHAMCKNKLSDKLRSVGPIHLSGIWRRHLCR